MSAAATPTIRTLNRRTPASGARVPPHNLQAEESLLGAMLLSRSAIEAAVEVGLADASFYKPAHGHIYDAVTSLYAQGEPADPVTVADELSRADLLEAVGGAAVLISLQAGTPAIGNAGRYATIVQEHATLRQLIDVAGEIAEIGYSLPEDVESAVDQAETLVFDLRPGRVKDALQGNLRAQIAEEWRAPIEAKIANGGAIDISTGFRDLDWNLGGLLPERLHLFAGRPGQGKSDVACHMSACVGRDRLVLWFSLEMSRGEILNRLISARANIDRSKVERGLVPSAWEHLDAAAEHVGGLMLDIRDAPRATLMDVRAAARRAKPALIIVDHIDLMETPPNQRHPGRHDLEVGALAWGLKVLAKEMRIPVVALVQLNRNLESRANKRPTLADLAESGKLEQHADTVVFVYRDEEYNDETTSRGIAELGIGKNRGGPKGIVRVRSDVVTGRWGDLSRRGAA